MFRNGKISRLDSLRPISTHPLNGYPLANELYHFLERIKDCTAEFCTVWGIKFDTRFVESNTDMANPGVITLRDNANQSLANLITPLSSHNYCYSAINCFKGKAFSDVLQAELVFLMEEDLKGVCADLVGKL